MKFSKEVKAKFDEILNAMKSMSFKKRRGIANSYEYVTGGHFDIEASVYPENRFYAVQLSIKTSYRYEDLFDDYILVRSDFSVGNIGKVLPAIKKTFKIVQDLNKKMASMSEKVGEFENLASCEVTMKTGYFAKARTYLKEGLVPVSIALYKPKTCPFFEYPALAPTRQILTEWKSGPYAGVEEHYIKRYKEEVLSKLNPKKVVKDLMKLCKVDDPKKIILLCYEAPTKFCHRHIVADWLTEHGFETIEYMNG